MPKDLSSWPNIISAVKSPLSLVALFLLVGMVFFTTQSQFVNENPEVIAPLLAISILGVYAVAMFQIIKGGGGGLSANDTHSMADTIGTCVATAAHAHISNLEIPEERVQAYARLAGFLRGQEGVANAEFRETASKAIIVYAYTAGGCNKADIEACMSEMGF